MKFLKLAYIELALSMAIVGSSVVVGKLIVANLPVFLANGLRFALASAILITILFLTEKKLPKLTKKEFFILFIQSLTGCFLFGVLLLYGLKFTTASAGGIITSTTPAVIGIISFFFLRERLNFYTTLAIGLTVTGVMAINFFDPAPSNDTSSLYLLGNLMIFGAVIGEALYTILGKMITRLSPLAISTFLVLFATCMSVPFSIYEAWHFDFSLVPLQTWYLIIYSAIFVTSLSFVLWFRGLAKVDASIAAVFTGVMPISALFFSYVILHEQLMMSHVIGIVCVLLGIGLITLSESKKQKLLLKPLTENR